MKSRLFIIPLLFAAAIAFAGGIQEGNASRVEESKIEASDSGSITVIDSLGRQVTLEYPAKTVAWTNYTTPEVMKILNAWEFVVAGGSYLSDEGLYPGFADMPRLFVDVYQQYSPNLEKLIELNPDLLIVEVIPLPGLDELLKSLDGIINVVCVQTASPEGFEYSYEILGKLLNREKEAAEYMGWVNDMKERIMAKTRDLPNDKKTKYFLKTGMGDVMQLATFTNEMAPIRVKDEVTGGVNIAADLPSQGGWINDIDPEWLAQQDYDVIFIGDAVRGAYGFNVGDTSLAANHREEVMKLPVFSDSRAVKEGRVYTMSELFAGANMTLSYPYVAKALHPDLFADMDPVAIHQEYMTRFMRSDAIIAETAVYFYPLP